MIQLNNLVDYLNNLLEIEIISNDPSNNGLQVQGSSEIRKIIFGVDASIEMIESAQKVNADFIFVHHGISWGANLKYIVGNNYSRINLLIKNDISLFGVHLPLDAHSSVGNNAVLANMIALKNQEIFCRYGDIEVGVKGYLDKPVPVAEFNEYINSKLDLLIKVHSSDICHKNTVEHDYVLDNSSNGYIQKIGIISGGAGTTGVMGAIDAGLDCLITGEFGHSLYHTAKEHGLSIIASGHYKTEVPGVIAVMNKIKEEIDVEVEFIHIPTGL